MQSGSMTSNNFCKPVIQDWLVRSIAISILMGVAGAVCLWIEACFRYEQAVWPAHSVFIAASLESIMLPDGALVVIFAKWLGGRL